MPTDNAEAADWLVPFAHVRLALARDKEWSEYIGAPGAEQPRCGVHLAVFVEPYLGYVLDGSKTVESRFSVNRCAPFGKVRRGDIILLKRSGGGVVGIARVSVVWSYQLDEESWAGIRKRFAAALRAQDPDFWESKKGASYATLMRIDGVRSFRPVGWEKRDRRGWVVLQESDDSSLFRGEDEQ